jgi:GlpG protein
MRQIATLADGKQAQRFADYLLTLRIETQLEEETGGWAVWVCDEDRVDQARVELEAFERDPSNTRYTQASPTATAIRRREAALEEDYQKRQQDMRLKMRGLFQKPRPVTLALIVISVLVALGSSMGANQNWLAPLKISAATPVLLPDDRAVTPVLLPDDWPGLEQVRAGQVWRLVTPMFIHFGILHLLFNMLWLYDLGGQVEARIGSLPFLGVVLLISLCSNLPQYYFGLSRFHAGELLIAGGGNFGGMSGVVYGLFGYVWVRHLYHPELRYFIGRNTVFWMMGWFFLCWAGMVGHVANVAHTGGLLLGLVLGYLPELYR